MALYSEQIIHKYRYLLVLFDMGLRIDNSMQSVIGALVISQKLC